MQPRTGIGRQRLRDVDAERHDRQPHPQADAHRVLDERRADGRSRLGPRHAVRLVEPVERVAAFFDNGNALNSFHKPDCVPGTMPGTTICPPFIQYSVGVGLRVRLPVMTLGVDIAQPLSTNAGPRLHINFSPKL